MSRIHCVGCGAAVVVDPQGVCPEGHLVGSRGARVEAAMGTATEHPDEPEPWIYLIEDTADATVGARANGHRDAPSRELRPVRLAGLPTDGFDDVPADAEALLRELHSLATLDERVPPPPPPGAPAPPAGAPAPPAATTPPPAPNATPRPARLDRDAMYDAFAELSALDAFADELASPTTPRGRGPATANGHGSARNGSRPANGHTANGHTANGHTANGHAANGRTVNGHPVNDPTTNGHGVNGARRGQDASPTAGDNAHDAKELAALFSSELGPAPTPAREPGDPAPTATRTDQLDELFSAAVSTPKLRPRDRAAQHTAPTAPDTVPAPDAADPAPATPTAPSGSAAADPPAPQVAAPSAPAVADDTPAPPAALDLSSFTAKGGTGRKAGRKRLFGR